MENLRKIQEPIRAAFSRRYELLKTELTKEVPDKGEVEDLFALLEEKLRELEIVDQNIQDLMIQDSVSSDDYAHECEAIDSFKEQFTRIRRRVNQLFTKPTHELETEFGDAMSVNGPKKRFLLPKIKVPEFGGDLKDWLRFWSLFKKIHEDCTLDFEDKFQFLLQAITPGSRARELIDSYPPTAENYPKVIESLKQRFGRDDLLVEVYVRELLRLVLQNALNQKEKLTITKLYDQLESHIRALDTLGVTSDKCAAMLYPLVESCLPEEVLRAWQRGSSVSPAVNAEAEEDASKNRLTKLLLFLRSEVEGEERIRLARAGFGIGAKKEKQAKEKEIPENVPTAAGLFAGESPSGKEGKTCVFCAKRHPSQECFLAQKMTMTEKRNCVQKRRACFVCLRSGHVVKDCKVSVKCLLCSKKHYPIMCPELKNEQVPGKPEDSPAEKPTLANCTTSPDVLLKTMVVKIKANGRLRSARVVIDDGSHRSYILKSLAEEMGLNPIGNEPMIHALFGGTKSAPVDHIRYEVPLMNPNGSFSCVLKMLDQQSICSTVPKIPRGSWLEELKQHSIWISDVGEGHPEVDILIGADAAGKLMTGKVRHLKSGLVAIETFLGWTIMGEVPGGRRSETQALMSMSLLNSEVCLSNLWRLDTLGIRDSAEVSSRRDLEDAAKEHFLQTVGINDEGRYEVHLPWIQGHPALASNRALAERRLFAATGRMVSSGVYEEYQKVLSEWLHLGIIEVVPDSEINDFGHYLPHRAVVKPGSATTKVRPVFDASAHEKDFPSLNDCLEKGPNMIDSIPSIILKFREKRFGVVADIEKAFLQMSLALRDRNFLRFLWWEEYAEKKMLVLRHTRAVFGVSSSPFLLAAVIELHLKNAEERFRAVAEVLLKSFYVDNLATSVHSEEELVEFKQKAQDLMASGKFHLRGWENTDLNKDVAAMRPSNQVPLLGLVWDTVADTLSCEKISGGFEGVVSKRKMLSSAQRIFDPIGFSSPVSLLPKKLLQSTWELKLGWDTELPTEISAQFRKWSSDLEMLTEVKIPRWFLGGEAERENWSLHTFVDASKTAYAAAVFMRVETRQGVKVQLLQAKSRLAPIKSVTIPRLELLSCLIGSRLTAAVRVGLDLKEVPTVFWSDSSTALSWIRRDDQWATFVGNRVKEIRSLSDADDWRHVPGSLNPADLPSRGCSMKQLLESRWWEGPSWLKLEKDFWPRSEMVCDEEEVMAERRKTVTSLLGVGAGWKEISGYFGDTNSFTKIVRRIAWLRRYFRWLKDKVPVTQELTTKELDAAEVTALRAVQIESFGENPENFSRGTAVVLGEDGLFHVKTRITERKELEQFKFPVLLPSHHPIVQSLIHEVHVAHCHAGVSALMTALRERFWIIRSRKAIRSVIAKCVRCMRFNSKRFESVPAALPIDRVRDAAVFEVIGIDLAGPLFLRGGPKSWIVLYTCAIYRAMHLELVTSLSTEAFLLSLRRFIARRGRPVTVFTDNGTNFHGAENLFRSLDWDKIQKSATARRIHWKFNPPTAAWWGGWWERMVRMVKQLLRRILGRASLSYEELATILCDCESVINGRPLTYVSDNMEDLCPISPSMFLQDVREVGVPDLDELDHASLNRRCKYRLKLQLELRKRFRAEYLGQLVHRANAKPEVRKVAVGDVVLVGSDNVKRMDWPLAKIMEVLPGKDGHVRLVRVKTGSGEYLRPIQRIYPLEVLKSQDSEGVVVPDSVAEDVAEEEKAKGEIPEKEPERQLRTRAGRLVKSPVKFNNTCLSLFSGHVH